MATIVMNKKDEVIMKLVHYFITEENYNPIVVNGVKDEIWLENTEGPYRIVRINSNNIFNKEQLQYDHFKIENIVHQIKKKTLSFQVNTLNILLNVNEDLKIEEENKRINSVVISNNDLNITNKDILEAFPHINDKLLKDTNGVDLIINVTKDINKKTEETNKRYERTFKAKKIFITPLLITLCIALFLAALFIDGVGAISSVNVYTSLKLGGNTFFYTVGNREIFRLLTYMFNHGSLIHLLINMYSLYIIGTQLETFLGKAKYVTIYLVSGICGGLLSLLIYRSSGIVSVGASGAIFGLLGSLLYFGYHYRNYLSGALKSQIIPIIVLNLAIGFLPGMNIDNACHIGGLLAGALCTMALGIDERSKKRDRINGVICLLGFMAILVYLLFFR